MRFADNEIADCANGGILIHRWKRRTPTGRIVTGNRIERIGARDRAAPGNMATASTCSGRTMC